MSPTAASPLSACAPGLLRIKREPAACQVAEVTTSAQPPPSPVSMACCMSPGAPFSPSASSPLSAKKERSGTPVHHAARTPTADRMDVPLVLPPQGSPFQMVQQDPRSGRYHLFIPHTNIESILWPSLSPGPILLPQPQAPILCPSPVNALPHLMSLPSHMLRGLVHPQLSPMPGAALLSPMASPSPRERPPSANPFHSPTESRIREGSPMRYGGVNGTPEPMRSPLCVYPSPSLASPEDSKQPGLALFTGAASSSPMAPNGAAPTFVYDRSPIPAEPDSKMSAPTYLDESVVAEKLSDSAYGTASCTDVSSDHIPTLRSPSTSKTVCASSGRGSPTSKAPGGEPTTAIGHSHISDSEVTTTTVLDGNVAPFSPVASQASSIASPASWQSPKPEVDSDTEKVSAPLLNVPLDCRVFETTEKEYTTIQNDTANSVSSEESEDDQDLCEPPQPAESLSPDVFVKVSVPDSQADFDRSGLELLYDSIEQFERSRKLEEEATEQQEPEVPVMREESSPQNGLFALCAYAERCFEEELENGWKAEKEEENTSPSPERVEIRRSSDVNRNYSSVEAEQEVKKFLATRQDPSLSAYSAMGLQVDPIQAVGENELHMRTQLAELQRKYREKQRELSKLVPRKSFSDAGDSSGGSVYSPTAKKSSVRNGRSKKKSAKFSQKHRKRSASKHRDNQSDLPPPVLERATDLPPSLPPKFKWPRMDAPPMLTPSRTTPLSNGSLTTNGGPSLPPPLTPSALTSPPLSPVSTPVTYPNERDLHPPLCRLSLVKLPSVNNQKRRWSVDCHPPPPHEAEDNVIRNQNGVPCESDQSRRDSIEEALDRTWTPSLLSQKSSTNYRLPDVYDWNKKRKFSSSSLMETASKKRKVGRPKKHCLPYGASSPTTETIVSKKSRSKSSIVGYLLGKTSAVGNNGCLSRSPRSDLSADALSLGSGSPDQLSDSYKAKENLEKSISSPDHGDTSPHHRPKIRPKLKAEVKVKETWEDDDLLDWTTPTTKFPAIQSDPLRPMNQASHKFVTNRHTHSHSHNGSHKDPDEEWLPKKAKTKLVPAAHPVRPVVVPAPTNHQRPQPKFAVSKVATAVKSPINAVKSPHPNVGAVAKVASTATKIMNSITKSVKKTTAALAREKRPSLDKPIKKPVSAKLAEQEGGDIHTAVGDPESCVLTDERLPVDNVSARTLTAKDGMFYAGQLSAVRPPDLYSVLLDGERASRPNICSREEVLQETILEVRPRSAASLSLGTRICAYWSQQYRCMYPGTVAEPSTPDPELDDEFVNVEFDDGDSGRINIRDIRFLPPDYPLVVNDPNPLLTLGKRRRRNSTSMDSKDRRSSGEGSGSTSSVINGTESSTVTESEHECLSPDKPAVTEGATDITSNGIDKPSSPSNGAILTKSSSTIVLAQPISAQMLDEVSRKRLKKKRREKLKRLRDASNASLSTDFNGVAQPGFVKKHKHKHHKHHKHKKHRHHSATNMTNGYNDGPVERMEVDNTSPVPDKEKAPVLSSEATEEVKPVSTDRPVASRTETATPISIPVPAPVPEEVPVVTSPASDVTPVLNKTTEKKLKLSIKKATDGAKLKDKQKSDEMNSDDNEKENGLLKKESKETAKENKAKKKTMKKQIVEETTENGRLDSPTKSVKKLPSPAADAHSKMAAFLPVQQLWGWSGKGHKRPGGKGRGKKEFYKCIQRGDETITVGDCAVFLSTGQPDQPFIGRIEALWEAWNSNKVVRVKWFYHPQETIGCPTSLKYPGALFESDHCDENDVQTIARKCSVLPLQEYASRFPQNPKNFVRDNTDVYYLAGFYDPSNQLIKLEKGVV